MAFQSYSYNGFNPCYEPYPAPYGGPSSYSDMPMSPPPSSHGSRSSSAASCARRSEDSNAYFLPGHGISKSVIFSSYQRLLGPTATIRPFSYQQREGYMLTHTGSPLTKNQIEDLKNLSREYEEKEAMRMISRSGKLSPDEVYVNQPVPVQQRRRY